MTEITNNSIVSPSQLEKLKLLPSQQRWKDNASTEGIIQFIEKGYKVMVNNKPKYIKLKAIEKSKSSNNRNYYLIKIKDAKKFLEKIKEFQ